MKTPTPREMETQLKGRCPSLAEVTRLYAARDSTVATLAQRARIEPSDLDQLDRLGRFKVADAHWHIVSAEAQQALLTDTHHQVRSAAICSQQRALTA